jgi:L-ascorbate metabolism protein UlaG (beta-lactamase superfamily)
MDITRPAHACIKIITSSGKIIYIDPFQVSEDKADYIFITHEHYDHCSIADIKKIIKPETVVITVPDCQSKLSGLKFKELKLVKPGSSGKLEHLDYQAVPAYNLNKQFHLKEHQWVGFILKIDGKLLYHTGDSDVIPEMKHIVGLDVIFVPVSGHYVMDSSEAAKLVNFLKPKIAVPMHYGAGVAGTQQDAENFKSLVTGSEVVIL